MRNLKRKTSILGLVLLLSMAISAQPYGNKNSKCQGQKTNNCDQGQQKFKKHERMVTYLELTEEQQTKMEAQRLAVQKTMLPLKNELNEKKARMRTLSSTENADMKAINSLIDDMGTIKTKMAKIRAEHHQEVRKMLTEEQRIKFDSNAGNRGQHKKGRRMH